MKVEVDSQETLNALVAVCNEACKGGLQVAKMAVIIVEATKIKENTDGQCKVTSNLGDAETETSGGE